MSVIIDATSTAAAVMSVDPAATMAPQPPPNPNPNCFVINNSVNMPDFNGYAIQVCCFVFSSITFIRCLFISCC